MTTEEVGTPPGPAGGAEQHRIASGTIAIQASRIVAMAALVGVATVLGRTYSLSEFGVYGLTLSFAGYVLFVQGSVEAAAIREIASARTQEERDRAFSATVLAYATLGALAGVVIAAVGNAAIELFDIPGPLRDDARLGLVALGLVTLVGWPLTVFQNVFHGTQRFRLAATVDVIVYLAFAVLMTTLVIGIDAPLWIVVGAGGSIPVLTGLVAFGPFLRLSERFHLRRATVSVAYARHFAGFSGAVFLTAITDIVIYSLDRAVLAALRSAATVGLYEGAVRPQQLIRLLQGTLVVTVLPTSSRYVAEGDQPRLRELLLRGTRYVLAVTLPFTVAFMALSSEILEVWLGDRYTAAATAMTIFVGSWIVGANTGVAGSMLWAAGRTRAQVTYAWLIAAVNLGLSIWFTSLWGLEGVVLGTTVAYLVAFPLFIYYTVSTFPVTLADLAREAWLPAYSVAAGLGAALIALDAVADLSSPAALVATGVASVGAYWTAFYGLWLRPEERIFFRELLGNLTRRR